MNNTDNTAYIMPIRAIKSIMLKELEVMRKSVHTLLRGNMLSDVPRNVFEAGNDALIIRIQEAGDYDALNDIVSEFYRMSLAEWIASL